MARGSKAKYTSKQKRQARHIEKSAEKRGYSAKRAAEIGWATVNKASHGGKKSGSGRGKRTNRAPYKKGGKKGGGESASRSAAARSRSAKKAARTRKRRR